MYIYIYIYIYCINGNHIHDPAYQGEGLLYTLLKNDIYENTIIGPLNFGKSNRPRMYPGATKPITITNQTIQRLVLFYLLDVVIVLFPRAHVPCHLC